MYYLERAKTIKLYLKKLLQTFLLLAALIVLTALLFILLIWLKPQMKAAIVYFCLLLSAILLLYAIFLKRHENKRIKAAYLDAQPAEVYSFWKDYLVTLKTRENVVHTLAFLTILFFNGIRIATSLSRPIGGLLLQITIVSFLFTTLNTLIWCFVHKRWHKSRYGTQ
ncbi:MAG: hypothetical protein IJX01_04780 [Oscillospiraceae bacterium]|nr:hypothetical protein [Oscillospiraceae bacterium]